MAAITCRGPGKRTAESGEEDKHDLTGHSGIQSLVASV